MKGASVGDDDNTDPATGPGRHRAVRVVQASHRSYTPRMDLLKTGRTNIIARFVPIIRTFAPSVAGAGKMGCCHFGAFNIGGGVAWVVSLLLLGFYFDKLPFVKDQFHYVVFAVIFISIPPVVWGWAPPRWASRTEAPNVEASRQSQRG